MASMPIAAKQMLASIGATSKPNTERKRRNSIAIVCFVITAARGPPFSIMG